MPLAAPVTMATLPATLPIVLLSMYDSEFHGDLLRRNQDPVNQMPRDTSNPRRLNSSQGYPIEPLEQAFKPS